MLFANKTAPGRERRKCERMKRRIAGKVIIAMLLAVAVFFAGCTKEKLIEYTLETSLEYAIDSAVAEDEDAAEVVAHLRQKSDIKVLSSEISANGVTAKCSVSAPDLTAFVENFDAKDYETREELVDAIKAAIDAAPVTSREVTVGFESTGDGYAPLSMEDFLNAYCGGSLELFEDIQN